MTPAELIEKYLKLRNRVADIKQKHIDELAPFGSVMRQIETELLKHLDEAGLDSFKGEAGTAYKQTATSCTVSEWNKTLEYIKQYEAWDLLEARVTKTAALAMIEETGQPIPGLKISQAVVLRVRTG